MAKEKAIVIQLNGLGWTGADMEEVYRNLQAELSFFLRAKIKYVAANGPRTVHVSVYQKLDNIHFVNETSVLVTEDECTKVK